MSVRFNFDRMDWPKVAAKALHMSEPTLEELKDDKLKNDGIPLVCSISKQSYYLHLEEVGI